MTFTHWESIFWVLTLCQAFGLLLYLDRRITYLQGTSFLMKKTHLTREWGRSRGTSWSHGIGAEEEKGRTIRHAFWDHQVVAWGRRCQRCVRESADGSGGDLVRGESAEPGRCAPGGPRRGVHCVCVSAFVVTVSGKRGTYAWGCLLNEARAEPQQLGLSRSQTELAVISAWNVSF